MSLATAAISLLKVLGGVLRRILQFEGVGGPLRDYPQRQRPKTHTLSLRRSAFVLCERGNLAFKGFGWSIEEGALTSSN